MKKKILFVALIMQTVMFSQDGTLDTTFSTFISLKGPVQTITLQPDGKIFVGSQGSVGWTTGMYRLDSNGFTDATFNLGAGFGSNSQVNSIVIKADGKIHVGGRFNQYNGTNVNNIVRLESNGILDPVFDPNKGFSNKVNSIALLSPYLLVGGSFSTYYTPSVTTANRIYKVQSTNSYPGMFNVSPAVGFNQEVKKIVFQGSNKFLVGGTFTSYNGFNQNYIVKIDGGNGNTDTSFNTASAQIQPPCSGCLGEINSIVIQSDGKILVGGDFKHSGGVKSNGLIRLNTDGSIDNSFDTSLIFQENTNIDAIALQPDGKILIGGFLAFNTTNVKSMCRLNSDGSLDGSFNVSLQTYQPIGSTYILGSVNSIQLQADGKVLVGGDFDKCNGVGRAYFVRLNNPSLSTIDFTKTKISLYPNPVKDILNISLAENISIENYEIYDLIGKNVISKTTTENFINVSELSNGIYVIKVITSEGVMTNKFIK